MDLSLDVRALRDRLAAFPTAFRAAASIAGPRDARWKPAPEHWSILEIACHLLDEEREDFRVRAALTLEDPEREWPRLDLEGVSERRGYLKRDLEPVLDEFTRERARSVAWIDSLPAGTDFARARPHERFGPMHAGMLLAAWAAHDALHLRQLARRLHDLAKRDAGPYRVDYAGEW